MFKRYISITIVACCVSQNTLHASQASSAELARIDNERRSAARPALIEPFHWEELNDLTNEVKSGTGAVGTTERFRRVFEWIDKKVKENLYLKDEHDEIYSAARKQYDLLPAKDQAPRIERTGAGASSSSSICSTNASGQPTEKGRMIGDYYYTDHALKQMRERGVELEDVRWVLSFGTSYPDRTDRVKVADKNKKIGVVINPKRRAVVTVISFPNQENLNNWLPKHRGEDPLAWLAENRSTQSAAASSTVQAPRSYVPHYDQARWEAKQREAKLAEERESSYSDDEYEAETATAMKKLGLGNK